MSTKIGHFEILGELSNSDTGAVYKANDPQNGQTVALKAIKLTAFGDSAAELQNCLLQEADATKTLTHPNLPPVYGAGEIDGQFVAAMEYIQGNSIATIIARKEGFSIWDLLDIGRQVCSGLDHASSRNIFHHSLEPAKIMCGWDGTVRILGFGVSSVGKFARQMPGLPSILHYMSPEQIRGESLDARSNLFSFGSMFYEMVTDCKPFAGEDAELVRHNILLEVPVPPHELNPKLLPALSDLIMKTLAKDPNQRYQSGRELLEDLERCKESKPQAVKKAAAPAAVNPVIPEEVKAATQAKFIASAAGSAVRPAAASPLTARSGAVKPVATPASPTNPSQPASTAALSSNSQEAAIAKKSAPPPALRSAAAAASSGGGSSLSAPQAPKLQASRPPDTAKPTASMSSAVQDEPTVRAPQVSAPRIAVDPLMAEDAPSRGGKASFSEMTELPPLQDIYLSSAPAPAASVSPEPHAANPPTATIYDGEPEQPKAQPREVAQKAMKEIKNLPPRLMVYSIAAAAVLILIIAVVLVLHVNTLNNDGDSPRPSAAQPVPPATKQPAVQTQAVQILPAPAAGPAPQFEGQVSPQVVETRPSSSRVASSAAAKGKNARKKIAAPITAAVAPGQMAIDSTPQGAQVQIDGASDPAWVTPFTLPGVAAGQHSVTVSKPGYSSDTRSVDVTAGSKSFVVTYLNQLVATLSVSSTPAGANIFVDGKDVGKVTPAQVTVEKGQHVVLVRKPGFLDETTSAPFALGQTFAFAPALRSLGNVDDIKTVGKMKKMFGGKEAQNMSALSIKTQPKGAQIAINQHMLDKNSPVEVSLDPGNYIVDITLTGYAPMHKVITVDKGGKAVIDEVLQHD